MDNAVYHEHEESGFRATIKEYVVHYDIKYYELIDEIWNIRHIKFITLANALNFIDEMQYDDNFEFDYMKAVKDNG